MKKIFVTGHSCGGFTTLLFFSRYPEKAGGGIAYAPACFGKLSKKYKAKKNGVEEALAKFKKKKPSRNNHNAPKLIDKYNAKDVVWAQEEPRNMGAWGHMLMHLDFAKSFRVASRRFYSSPASGSSVRFRRRHQQVIDYVFDEKKDNFKPLKVNKKVEKKGDLVIIRTETVFTKSQWKLLKNQTKKNIRII